MDIIIIPHFIYYYFAYPAVTKCIYIYLTHFVYNVMLNILGAFQFCNLFTVSMGIYPTYLLSPTRQEVYYYTSPHK